MKIVLAVVAVSLLAIRPIACGAAAQAAEETTVLELTNSVHTGTPRENWLSAFTDRLEMSTKAVLELQRPEVTLKINGVAAAYRDDTATNISSLVVTAVTQPLDDATIKIVKDVVNRTIRKYNIERAEISFQDASLPSRSTVITTKASETNAPAAP